MYSIGTALNLANSLVPFVRIFLKAQGLVLFEIPFASVPSTAVSCCFGNSL